MSKSQALMTKKQKQQARKKEGVDRFLSTIGNSSYGLSAKEQTKELQDQIPEEARAIHNNVMRVGVVTHRHVMIQTVNSLMGVMSQFPSCFDSVGMAYVDIGRNQIAERAVAFNNKYLLFVDFDNVFDPLQVNKLVLALEADPGMGCVAAHYVKWDGSEQPMCGWYLEDEGRYTTGDENKARAAVYEENEDVVEVQRLGTGLCLIDVDCLKKIQGPWFRMLHDPEVGHVGEDTYFALLLRKHGYRPSIHFGAVSGHMGPTMWVPKNYSAVLEDDKRRIKEAQEAMNDDSEPSDNAGAPPGTSPEADG